MELIYKRIGEAGYENIQVYHDIRLNGVYPDKRGNDKEFFKPIKAIIPDNYFRTTGDAIAKLTQMEKDAWELAGSIRALLNLAKVTKGNSKYLEVSRDADGRIVCQPKSAREKTPHPKPMGPAAYKLRRLRKTEREEAMRRMQNGSKNNVKRT